MRRICEALLRITWSFRKETRMDLDEFRLAVWACVCCVSTTTPTAMHSGALQSFLKWHSWSAEERGFLTRTASGSLSNGTWVVLWKSYPSVNLKPAISSFLFKFYRVLFTANVWTRVCLLYFSPYWASIRKLIVRVIFFFLFVFNPTFFCPKWIVKILNFCKYY